MASFILVPGAWHGGWCFERLRPFLESAGHEVIAVDLPGMGADDATIATVTLAQWADHVAGLVAGAQAPVILCGHSRGGIVISEAAEKAPDKVAALVYIAAMMYGPDFDRHEYRARSLPNPDFEAIVTPVAGGAASLVDPARAASVIAHLAPAEAAAEMAEKLVAEPAGPRRTALSVTWERYGRIPRHYVECVQDKAIPLADQRLMQEIHPGASVVTMDTDHSPHLSAPEDLAKVLIGIAEQVSALEKGAA